MGYREYFAVVNKEKTEAFRHLGPNYFMVEDEDEEHRAFYQLVAEKFGRREEFCIGGLDLDFSNAEHFFNSPESQEMCEHYNPRIATPDMLLQAIEAMRKFVLDYYQNIEFNGPEHAMACIVKKIETWSAPYRVTPYNLSPKTTNIVQVMQTEYEIFELVRIYKSIDWTKEYVIFYGW